MQALIVEPLKAPYVKEIGEELEDLQREVGGYIEALYPFEDEVAVICNEEGHHVIHKRLALGMTARNCEHALE